MVPKSYISWKGVYPTIIYKYMDCIWMFPKIGVPQNGWFMMEHLIKIDDLGVPLFLETPIYVFLKIPTA